MLARLIDAITVFFVLWVLVVLQIFFFMPDLVDALSRDPWGDALAPLIFYVALHLGYEVVFHTWNRGQTPAKDLLKIRVERIDDGEDPRWWQSAIRWLPFGAFRMVPPLWLGTLLPALVAATAADEDRRMVHDRLAGTRVVAFDRNAEEADESDDDEERPTLREVRREIREKYGPRNPFDLYRQGRGQP